tara:strand:- start:273 stop:473 length:201 start_codon:yes stop_codon:yes gene_type:complete
MKINELFKMNLDDGEAEFKPTKEFNNLNPLLKCDILKDWFYDVQKEYNKSVGELESCLKEIRNETT